MSGPSSAWYAPWTWASATLAATLALQLGSIVAQPPGGAPRADAAPLPRLAPYLGSRVARLEIRPDERSERGGVRAELPPSWLESPLRPSDFRRLMVFIDGQRVPVGFGEPDASGPLPQAFARSPRARALILRCGAPGCGDVVAARPDAWFELVLHAWWLSRSPARAAAAALLVALWALVCWHGTRSWPARAAAVAALAAVIAALVWVAGEGFARPWAISIPLAEMAALAMLAVLLPGRRSPADRPQATAGDRSRWAARLALLAATSAFAALSVSRAVQDGVCCGDDALFAVAAKDLARGYGYAQGGGLPAEAPYFGLSDGRITVGPVLVVPVAAVIAMFGNRHWVPGAVSIVLWLGLFALAAAALRPFGDPRRRDLAMIVFLALCFALCAWHFEHWYAMLGEVHACLLVWLAVAVWARRPLRRRNLATASLLLGLACLTKLVAVLCVPPFLVGVAVARGVRRPARRRQATRDVAASLAWSLLPAAVFQGYRLAAAGPRRYLEENRSWIEFTLAQGRAEPDGPGLLAHVAEVGRQVYERFGIGAFELLLLSSLALVVVTRRARPHLRLQAAVLLGCVLANAGWFLFLSRGWPRYLLIAIVLAVAAAVLPLFVLRRTVETLAYALFLAACTLPAWPRLGFPLRREAPGWFAPSTATRNAIAVAARIDAATDGLPFYGPGWPAMSDLEYLSAHAGRLRRFPQRFSSRTAPPHAIAFNSRFVAGPVPEFDGRLAACRRDADDRRPYVLAWCDPAAAGPATP